MYPPAFTLCLFCNIGSQKFISIPSIIQSYNLIFFYSARVELELRGVNLTHRLETALTLRNYLQKQVHKLVEGVTTAEIARTVSGIWPEEVGVL